LSKALANGGDFAEIFLEDRVTASIGCEDRKIERVVSGIDRGAGLRVAAGEMTAFASTNDLSASGLRKLAERVSRGISAPVGEYRLPEVSDVEFGTLPIKYPSSVKSSEKVAKVLEANEAAWSLGDRIVQVQVRYGDSRQRIIIANSDGLFVHDERNYIIFLVQAVGKKGEIIQTGYEPVGGLMGFELFDDTSPERVARLAGERALRMLDAGPAPTGIMPVVISSICGEAGRKNRIGSRERT
jgi:TldD protein